jgi:hypothetical protein
VGELEESGRATELFAVEAMMRVAGLSAAAGRVTSVSRILDAARSAATGLEETASRVSISDAEAFDPAWGDKETQS